MLPSRSLRPSLAAGLLCVLASTACTSVPQREFALYLEAFGAAREQSEIVLADYGAARAARAAETAAHAPGAAGAAGALLSQRLGLEAIESASGRAADDVAVRLAAWRLVDAYDQALVALARGDGTAAVEAAVGDLVQGLRDFPVAAVAETAAGLAPYGAAVSQLLGLLEEELRARRFRDAVLAAEGPMRDFVGLLRKDAVLFRNYRVGRLDSRFVELELDLFERAERFGVLLSDGGWDPAEAGLLAERMAASRQLTAGVETFPAPVPDSTRAGTPDPMVMLELRALADDVEARAAAARALVDELGAYHEMMRVYALLLDELEQQVAGLARAVREESGQLPSADELSQLVDGLRLAQRIYTETR